MRGFANFVIGFACAMALAAVAFPRGLCSTALQNGETGPSIISNAAAAQVVNVVLVADDAGFDEDQAAPPRELSWHFNLRAGKQLSRHWATHPRPADRRMLTLVGTIVLTV